MIEKYLDARAVYFPETLSPRARGALSLGPSSSENLWKIHRAGIFVLVIFLEVL